MSKGAVALRRTSEASLEQQSRNSMDSEWQLKRPSRFLLTVWGLVGRDATCAARARREGSLGSESGF